MPEIQKAMRGLAVYEGLPNRHVQQSETLRVDVTMLKIVKPPNHVKHVERLDRNGRIIPSREHNKNIKRWDRTLSNQPATEGCTWRDVIVIDAGPMTFLTARFYKFAYSRQNPIRYRARCGRIVTSGKRDATNRVMTRCRRANQVSSHPRKPRRD